MKPLFVLLVAFGISITVIRFFNSTIDFHLAGRIAMACMLLFTSIAHFVFNKGMAMMLPQYVPCRAWVVYFTGLLEIAGAVAVLLTPLQYIAGWGLISLFILMLPANIYAAYHNIDYQKGTYSGPGLHYLWFRVPLQILFIVWTYLTIL